MATASLYCAWQLVGLYSSLGLACDSFEQISRQNHEPKDTGGP
jgi:hypothetical protein